MNHDLTRIKSMIAKFLRPKANGKGLYCFNYHRIGDVSSTQFDPNVFSCSAEQFDEHLSYLQREFRLVDISMLVELINSKTPISEKLALLTFDDGYIDNYQVAFPALKKHGVKAVFFLPTDFIGDGKIPWWDEAAWLIKNCTNSQVKLSYWPKPIIINKLNIDKSIREILRSLKEIGKLNVEEKILELRNELNIVPGKRPNDERLFLNWDEVRELSDSGMEIGSHSNSHKILSHLPLTEQRKEIAKSITTIEENLNKKVSAFAYPVGGEDSYTKETIELLQEYKIQVAFNFVKGINTKPDLSRYQLQRIPAHGSVDNLLHLDF